MKHSRDFKLNTRATHFPAAAGVDFKTFVGQSFIIQSLQTVIYLFSRRRFQWHGCAVYKQFGHLFEERVRPFGSQQSERYSEIEG